MAGQGLVQQAGDLPIALGQRVGMGRLQSPGLGRPSKLFAVRTEVRVGGADQDLGLLFGQVGFDRRQQ